MEFVSLLYRPFGIDGEIWEICPAMRKDNKHAGDRVYSLYTRQGNIKIMELTT